MTSLRTMLRLAQLAIILIAITLAYIYRDVVKDVYDDATRYVHRINQELGIDFAYPPSPPSTVATAPAPSGASAIQAPVDQAQTLRLPAETSERLAESPREQASPSVTPSPGIAPPVPLPEAGVTTSPQVQAATETAPMVIPTPVQEDHPPAPPGMAPETVSAAGNVQPAPSPPSLAGSPVASSAGQTTAEPPAAEQRSATEQPTLQQPSLDSMLAQARTAAREGRHEQAEHGYLAIIQRYPDSYDAFGELGDLYYTQGRRDEAASSYYQAALRLLEAGYVREAEHLQEVIRPLSQTLATSLETKLTSQKRH